MNVTNSVHKITPFGGFNFVFRSFKGSGLADLIDKQLGMRVKNSGFTYSDIFIKHLAVYFNGGDCTEDLNDHLRDHLRDHLKNVRQMHVCSTDTVLRGIKELATESLFMKKKLCGVNHEFNLNPKINKLLVNALMHTGQLKRNKQFVLDDDNQIQPYSPQKSRTRK